MAALIRANGTARATPDHAIDLSTIVTRSCEPALNFHDNGSAPTIALVDGRSVVAVGIVAVVGIRIIGGIRVVKRIRVEWKSEVEEDKVVEMMMKMVKAKVMTMEAATMEAATAHSRAAANPGLDRGRCECEAY